jgi:hypothetical protein
MRRADFRTIPVGDIYLREELEFMGSSRTVGRRNRCFVRRVYSARVVGLEENMTVATYHGDGAEGVRVTLVSCQILF